MKLNRERTAAGLSLLLLVFGAYKVLWTKLSDSPPAISTKIPESTDVIPRIEPRLYFDTNGGDRTPFQLASDWTVMAPEPLAPPAVEPTRWFGLPLGKSPDPADVGFVYPPGPPVEVGGEEGGGDAEKGPAASGASSPGKNPAAEGASPPAEGGGKKAAEEKAADGKKAPAGAGAKDSKNLKFRQGSGKR